MLREIFPKVHRFYEARPWGTELGEICILAPNNGVFTPLYTGPSISAQDSPGADERFQPRGRIQRDSTA